MYRVISHIHKKRLLYLPRSIRTGVSLHELYGMIRKDVAAMCSFWVLSAERLHRPAFEGRKISATARTAGCTAADIDVKALVLRVNSKVPLT